MIYFVDTSALVKRYIHEQGSQWVVSWITPTAGNICIISQLASVEISSVFARREREKTLSPALVRIIRSDFLFHLGSEYLVIEIDHAVIAKARDLTIAYPLRTLDAIQLSCSIYARNVFNTPNTFVSADTNLLLVATAEGFTIDNPNLH